MDREWTDHFAAHGTFDATNFCNILILFGSVGIRNPTLYPAELWARHSRFIARFAQGQRSALFSPDINFKSVAASKRQHSGGAVAHIALVYNSMSGGYSARRIDALIDLLHQAGHRVSLFSDIGFSIKRDCPNADILCIAGGDGTVRTTLEYQRDAKVRPLCAVFPTGTVNLVAREVPYPRAARAFREIIDFQRPARVHHAGLVAGRLFLTSASVGPDSVAVHRLNIDLKRQIGRLAYIFALLAGPWPRPRLRVTSGGQTYDAEAVYVLKSRYFGGPFVLDEKAALTNDRFRVLLMPRARRRDVARLILYALTRGRFVDPAWQFLETTELEIAGDRPWPVQADGDIVSQLPVHIRIDPAPIPHL